MAANGNRMALYLVGSGIALFGIFATVVLSTMDNWCDGIESKVGKVDARVTQQDDRLREIEQATADTRTWREGVAKILEEIKSDVKQLRRDVAKR